MTDITSRQIVDLLKNGLSLQAFDELTPIERFQMVAKALGETAEELRQAQRFKWDNEHTAIVVDKAIAKRALEAEALGARYLKIIEHLAPTRVFIGGGDRIA